MEHELLSQVLPLQRPSQSYSHDQISRLAPQSSHLQREAALSSLPSIPSPESSNGKCDTKNDLNVMAVVFVTSSNLISWEPKVSDGCTKVLQPTRLGYSPEPTYKILGELLHEKEVQTSDNKDSSGGDMEGRICDTKISIKTEPRSMSDSLKHPHARYLPSFQKPSFQGLPDGKEIYGPRLARDQGGNPDETCALFKISRIVEIVQRIERKICEVEVLAAEVTQAVAKIGQVVEEMRGMQTDNEESNEESRPERALVG